MTKQMTIVVIGSLRVNILHDMISMKFFVSVNLILAHDSLFDITQKDFCALHFIQNENMSVLVDHILLETICLFCSCDFFSQIFILK